MVPSSAVARSLSRAGAPPSMMRAVPVTERYWRCCPGRLGARTVAVTRGSAPDVAHLAVGVGQVRRDEFVAVGCGLQRVQTTEACGLPSALMVTRVASAPAPIGLRALPVLSSMRCSTARGPDSFP